MKKAPTGAQVVWGWEGREEAYSSFSPILHTAQKNPWAMVSEGAAFQQEPRHGHTQVLSPDLPISLRPATHPHSWVGHGGQHAWH